MMKAPILLVSLLLLNLAAIDAGARVSAYKSLTASRFYFQFGEVDISITPTVAGSRFSPKNKVAYKLFIKNGIPKTQEGRINYTIINEKGEESNQKSYDISVPANKQLETVINLNHFKEGNFRIKFLVVLNKVENKFDFKFSYSDGKKPIRDIAREREIRRVENRPPDEEDPDGTIQSKLKPNHEDGIYLKNDPIIYSLDLENKYKIAQEGTIGYRVKDAVTGKVVSGKSYDLRIPRRSSKHTSFTIQPPPTPGVYNLELAINTTTYDDTSYYAFGYEIQNYNTPYHKPPDFDDFWKEALRELADTRPDYKIEEDPSLIENDKFKSYRVEMTSIDNIRISGLLVIPKLLIGKKFPVVIGYMGYQMMAQPQTSNDFATFTISVRGSDKENMDDVNPDKKQLLVLNVEDPKRYIYRGIYMDCVRAVDFIFAREDLGFDVNRIAVVGGSQGATQALIVSALLNKKINTCVADNPVFCDFHINLDMQSQIRANAFSFAYIMDYLKERDGFLTQEQVLNTLSYFEVQNFMPKIKCPILYGVGLLDPLAPPPTTIGCFNKLKPEVKQSSEVYVFPSLGHEVTMRHNSFKSIWLYEKLVDKRGMK